MNNRAKINRDDHKYYNSINYPSEFDKHKMPSYKMYVTCQYKMCQHIGNNHEQEKYWSKICAEYKKINDQNFQLFYPLLTKQVTPSKKKCNVIIKKCTIKWLAENHKPDNNELMFIDFDDTIVVPQWKLIPEHLIDWNNLPQKNIPVCDINKIKGSWSVLTSRSKKNDITKILPGIHVYSDTISKCKDRELKKGDVIVHILKKKSSITTVTFADDNYTLLAGARKMIEHYCKKSGRCIDLYLYHINNNPLYNHINNNPLYNHLYKNNYKQ